MRIRSAIQISSCFQADRGTFITPAPFCFCQELLHVIGSREMMLYKLIEQCVGMERVRPPINAVCRDRRVVGTSPSAHFLPLHLPPFQIIMLHHSVCTSNHARIFKSWQCGKTFHFHGTVLRPPPTLTVAHKFPGTGCLAKMGEQP